LALPPIDAPHYPLPAHKKWYEGKGLRTHDQRKTFVGREEDLQYLTQLVINCQNSGSSAIAVAGIGGIGYKLFPLQHSYEPDGVLGKQSCY